MALNLNLRVSPSADAQLSYTLSCAYHMEELTRKVVHIYRSCFMFKIYLSRSKGSLSWSRGRDFSPSLPGDRYLKLGSKSDLWGEISGSIVWYNALAPRQEVLRSISFFYSNCGNPVLWLFHLGIRKCTKIKVTANLVEKIFERTEYFTFMF